MDTFAKVSYYGPVHLEMYHVLHKFVSGEFVYVFRFDSRNGNPIYTNVKEHANKYTLEVAKSIIARGHGEGYIEV